MYCHCQPTKVCDAPEVKVSIPATSNSLATLSVNENKPQLWSREIPNLYCAFVTVNRNGKPCNTYKRVSGIRTIAYAHDKGFLLNGRVAELKGVCQHHDLGPQGTAINTRALERQIEIMLEMGCNSIRTSHNPPAPERLNLCDRMEIVVQVEAFDC